MAPPPARRRVRIVPPTPSHEVRSSAAQDSVLMDRAVRCVRIARRTLPQGSTEYEIEEAALILMRTSDFGLDQAEHVIAERGTPTSWERLISRVSGVSRQSADGSSSEE